MSYVYIEQRPDLFTERGVATLLKIQENVRCLLRTAGAVRAQEAWKDVGGDSWQLLAVLDYLVETGHLREVTDASAAGQDRVFVAGRVPA